MSKTVYPEGGNVYERAQVDVIAGRMAEKDNPLIQIVVGPRQTGKSTMIAQALRKLDVPFSLKTFRLSDWLFRRKDSYIVIRAGAAPAQ